MLCLRFTLYVFRLFWPIGQAQQERRQLLQVGEAHAHPEDEARRDGESDEEPGHRYPTVSSA